MARQLTTKKTDRRILVVASLVLAAVMASLAWRELRGDLWQVAMYARERLAPQLWPHTPFESRTWSAAAVAERYVFARDLLPRLPGRTRDEIGELLGDQPKGDGWSYKLRPAGEVNLWYVLRLEFVDGRVSSARVRLAWLDP